MKCNEAAKNVETSNEILDTSQLIMEEQDRLTPQKRCGDSCSKVNFTVLTAKQLFAIKTEL